MNMNHPFLIFKHIEKDQPPSKNNEELKNIFKNGVKDFQRVYRKGGKNIKEWLANTNINIMDSSNIISYGC